MGGAFDPYHRWLGISPKDQPPNHYRLLGLERFESDHDVIDEAADRQMRHVRTHQSGQHGELSQQLLNEISSARRCLLNDVMRRDYDAQLRAREPAAIKTAQPLEVKALEVKPLPVAQPLPEAPLAKALPLEQPSAPSVFQVQQPAVNSSAQPANRYSARRRKNNPLLPLLIVAGGAGALLLIAVAVVASAMLTAEPETVVAREDANVTRPSNRSTPRPDSRTNSFPQPTRRDDTPADEFFGGDPIDHTDTTNTTVDGNSPFPDLGATAPELEPHPEPRGKGVTREDISPEQSEQVVARVEQSVATLQLPDGQGTAAFIVDERGWAITNYRFIAGSASATIAYGRTATRRVAGVIAANPRCDLVLLDVGPLPEGIIVAPLAEAPWHKREIALTISTPVAASHYVLIGQAYGPLSGAEARALMDKTEGFDLFGRRGYGEETRWVEMSRNGSDGHLGAPMIDAQSQVIGVTAWSGSQESNVGCAVSVVEIHELLRRANGRMYPLSALDGVTQLPPPAP